MKRLFLLTLTLIASCTLAMGQTLVRGVVRSSEDNAPLPQLTVLIKGTTTGVVTNLDGEYSIQVPSADAVLIFKYTGYDTQEITVNGRSTLNVTMRPALEEIGQVVVTAYGRVKKESLVGSQSSVSSKDLERSPVTNMGQALAAAAPGVQVTTSSGQPGSDAKIQIRGFGSMKAENEPLIVLDGAIYYGNLGSIPPQDIENIALLKDAASAALYGSNAGNGVLLVTTKKGGKEGARFTFTTSHGVSVKGMQNYEKLSLKEMYPARWQIFYNDIVYNEMGIKDPTDPSVQAKLERAGLIANNRAAADVGLEYMPFTGDLGYVSIGKDPLVVVAPIPGNNNAPQIVMPDGTLNPNISGLLWGDDLDWNAALFQPGYRQEYTLSGGFSNGKLKSYISLGYLDEDGYKIRTNYTRYNARLNASYTVNKYLTLGANVAYTRAHTVAPKTSEGFYLSNPFFFSRFISPVYPIHLHEPDGAYVMKNGKKVYDAQNKRPFFGTFNPVWESELDVTDLDRDAVLSRLFAEVNILPDLKFTVNASYDMSKPSQMRRYNSLLGDAKGLGFLMRDMGLLRSFTLNELLEYNLSIDKIHNFSFLLGHESYSRDYMQFYAEKKNGAIEGFDEFMNYTEMSDITSFSWHYRKEGFFTRINYDLGTRYNFTASYRLDGSSRFAPKKRWGHFWSLGAGWNISREAFMAPLQHIITNLKLRLSIGQTGNDALKSYTPYISTFTLGQNNGDRLGLRYKNAGNPDLVWETQTSYDIALDFNLYNRLSGTVGFFVKESKDLLFDYKLPTSTGVGSIEKNLGKIRNMGVEVDLRATLLRLSEFQWDLSLNATWFRNTIVTLPEANRKEGILKGDLYKYMEGHSIYSYWLNDFVEVDPQNGLAKYRMDPKLGDETKAIGKTGDSLLYTYNPNFAQKHMAGSPIPDLYGGFGTSMSWRGLEMNMQFAYQIGGLVYDNTYRMLLQQWKGRGFTMHADTKKAWKNPGDKTDIPRLDANKDYDSWRTARSDHWLIDGSALMLKNVSISYTLPQEWIRPLKYIKNVRVGISGDNLFLLTHRKGLNPLRGFSGDNSSPQYEYAQTFSGTISINF